MSGAQTPVGVQTVLGAAGACPVVRWNGKEYRMGHPTQEAKARLEELAADAAVARVEAMERRVKPSTFNAMLDRVTDRIQANEFLTWRSGWQEVVWSDGGALFALSLFREHHPEMTPDDARRLVEDRPRQYKAALARVLPDFFEVLLRGKELTPEQEAAVRGLMATFLRELDPSQPPTPANSST